jgi:hypothetical protein
MLGALSDQCLHRRKGARVLCELPLGVHGTLGSASRGVAEEHTGRGRVGRMHHVGTATLPTTASATALAALLTATTATPIHAPPTSLTSTTRPAGHISILHALDLREGL